MTRILDLDLDFFLHEPDFRANSREIAFPLARSHLINRI
jgi:hypothetical protein